MPNNPSECIAPWIREAAREIAKAQQEYDHASFPLKQQETCEIIAAHVSPAEGWISVEEKLPEDQQIVAVMYDGSSLPMVVRYRIDPHYGGFRHGNYALGNVRLWRDITPPSRRPPEAQGKEAKS